MGYILVFTTSGCVHSARLKKILSNRGIAFHEINIYQYPLYVDVLEAQSGHRTVPQVFFNNEYIGVQKM
jgi:glutaredoxin 3